MPLLPNNVIYTVLCELRIIIKEIVTQCKYQKWRKTDHQRGCSSEPVRWNQGPPRTAHIRCLQSSRPHAVSHLRWSPFPPDTYNHKHVHFMETLLHKPTAIQHYSDQRSRYLRNTRIHSPSNNKKSSNNYYGCTASNRQTSRPMVWNYRTSTRSSNPTHVSSSLPSSPLSPSITPTVCHSRLKIPYPEILSTTDPSPSPTHRTAFMDSGLFNGFLLVFPLPRLVR